MYTSYMVCMYIYIVNHRLVYTILWLNTWNYTLYRMGNVKNKPMPQTYNGCGWFEAPIDSDDLGMVDYWEYPIMVDTCYHIYTISFCFNVYRWSQGQCPLLIKCCNLIWFIFLMPSWLHTVVTLSVRIADSCGSNFLAPQNNGCSTLRINNIRSSPKFCQAWVV